MVHLLCSRVCHKQFDPSTVCYLNNYEDTKSIMAEFKKIKGVRYPKEIGSMAPSQKLTKFKPKELRIASNCGHIDDIFRLLHEITLISFLSWLELTCRNWFQREKGLCFNLHICSICNVIEIEYFKLMPFGDSFAKLKCISLILWE